MKRLAALLIAVVTLATSCSSGTTDTTAMAATTTTAVATTTTTMPPTTTVAPTTTVETTTTTPSSSESGVTVSRDIVYLELDGDEYLVDVYVPAGDGPWPVVVAPHAGGIYKNDPDLTMVAKAAAEAGMLVFVPNWVAQWPALSDMDAKFIRAQRRALPCALAFAQQEATEYGGDSNRTVIYGFSGGATSGSSLVLRPYADLTPGCLAQTAPVAPVGAVFGDAEYFLHVEWWDGAFEADLEEMQTIVAEAVDPALWKTDLPARFRFWAAADGSYRRSFDDPWDEGGWFAQRDPDGTIREDLDALGELDDNAISYIDEGLLLATRVQQAGIDTTFDILPGGHSQLGRIPEIVAYLLDAAGAG